jgi:hypothetical protein
MRWTAPSRPVVRRAMDEGSGVGAEEARVKAPASTTSVLNGPVIFAKNSEGRENIELPQCRRAEQSSPPV